MDAEAAHHHRRLAADEAQQHPGETQRRHLAVADEIVAGAQEHGGADQHPGQGEDEELQQQRHQRRREDRRHEARGDAEQQDRLVERHAEVQQRGALGGRRDVTAPEDLGEHAHGDVAEAVLPALLLAQPGLAVGRQLARHRDAGQVHRAPALDPAAIGEIEVLSDGVALPPAACLDRRTLPDAAGAVERQWITGPIARRLLDAEVGVERHHLHLGQCILVRI